MGLIGMAWAYTHGYNNGYIEGIDDNYPETIVTAKFSDVPVSNETWKKLGITIEDKDLEGIYLEELRELWREKQSQLNDKSQ